jgi:pyruvate kinase
MNVARFNFSHGDHEGHGRVLERLRKVGRSRRSRPEGGFGVARVSQSLGDLSAPLLHAASSQVAAAKGANVACLLDTKGPEIRTSMLRGGKDLELAKDQEVVLVAVGPAYKTWEGGINPETGVCERCAQPTPNHSPLKQQTPGHTGLTPPRLHTQASLS